MCVLTLSDFTDSIEVVIFPKVYKSASVHLDEVIKVSGKMNMYKDDSHNVIANKVETLANQVTIEKNITPLTIHLKKFQVSDANLDKLRTTISNYHGNREVCKAKILFLKGAAAAGRHSCPGRNNRIRADVAFKDISGHFR